jgi:Protein of unknown function (DUF917), N-terminal
VRRARCGRRRGHVLRLLQALQATEDFGPAALIDVDELPGDDMIMPCGGIGAPLVGLEKIEAGDEGERLRDLMQRQTGRTFGYDFDFVPVEELAAAPGQLHSDVHNPRDVANGTNRYF